MLALGGGNEWKGAKGLLGAAHGLFLDLGGGFISIFCEKLSNCIFMI